jgi:eukaryotic-like serine/threonine-protein kinase
MSRSFPLISSDKPLGGRYKIISQLGVGGFGRTFLAEDLHLPGNPECVIKQLKPQINSDDTLQMARRCFNTEAEVLYQLGIHDQIPRLLAHFEERQEFYLAQEFIEGEPLTKELMEGKPWTENQVLFFLKDILPILAFVHQQQVIHRDLKPSNLIRRRSDRRIVLIDFGAVKQVGTQNLDPEQGLTNITISIGTQGYMPNEQIAGKPRFSSDIYAIGILSIQALTGIHPRHLGEDLEGEIAWRHYVPDLNSALSDVLERMVRYDFRERYPTAVEALEALEPIPMTVQDPLLLFPLPSAPNPPKPEPSITASPNDVSGPIPEFSSADFTVAEEDLMSTAFWVHSETQEQTSSTAPQATSEEGSHQTNGAHRAVEATDATNGTGVTHVVSPSPPTLEEEAPSHPPKRWLSLRSAVAIAAIVGLSTFSIYALLAQRPENPNNPNDPQASPATPKPTPLDLKQQAAQLLSQADQLRQKNQYQEALKLYQEAIKLFPKYAEAHAGECEVLNQLKRPEQAIVACNDALAYKPDYYAALWSKGNALLQQNRTYEALRLYEDVTYLQSNFADGWVKRGVALQRLGRSAEALNALDISIQIQRNSAEAWITKGAALLNLQRYEDAVVALDKALQLKPNDPDAQRLRRQAKAKLNG